MLLHCLIKYKLIHSMKRLILSIMFILNILNAGIIEDTYKESKNLKSFPSAKKIISRILNFETKNPNVHVVREKAATHDEVKMTINSLENAAKYIAKNLKKNGKKTLSELSYSNIFGKRYDDSEKGLFKTYKKSDEIKTHKEIGIKIVLEAIQQELDFSPSKMYVMGGVKNFVNKEEKKAKLGGYTQCVIFNLISKIEPGNDPITPYENIYYSNSQMKINGSVFITFLNEKSSENFYVNGDGKVISKDDYEKGIDKASDIPILEEVININNSSSSSSKSSRLKFF